MNHLASVSTVVPLYPAGQVLAERKRFRGEEVPNLDKANSFWCPSHRKPARGWILLARSDYDKIRTRNQGLYSTSLELNFDEAVKDGQSVTLQNLSIVNAQCVTMGLADDKNDLYLVELTDARGILSNRWFQFPTNSYYNLLAPAYPGQYYEDSLNSGSAWTWDGMIGDLWGQMPLLGTYPGLPIIPTGTPMNWALPGVPAWDALCDMLDHLGLAVAVNLENDAPYTIIDQSADDDAFSELQGENLDRLQDDMQWIDTGAGRVPGTVIVYFNRRNQFYGTEETVRRDDFQWETDPLYSINILAPAFFTGAVGTHLIWDDFVVRFDTDGNPLAGDVTTAGAIAAERVEQYFADIYSGTSGSMRQTYAGAIPFFTGSRCDEVAWIQHRGRAGWETLIVRGYSLA